MEHRPDDVEESLGGLISSVAELASLPPDPWQRDSHELMMSLRADGNWACADYAEWVGRQNGKTGGIGVPRVLGGLLLLPERLFLWSSHLASTSTAAFEMVRDALLTLGHEVKPDLIEVPPLDLPGALQESLFVQVVSANGKEGFRTWTADRRPEWRKRVLMVSRSRGGGRGIPVDVRLIDEAFAYTGPQQAALAPTRLAKPFSQTIYLSSPPLAGDEGEVMYRLRERAEEGDPRLGYRDWGLALTLDEFARWPAPRRRAFLRNRENWRSALPALGLGRVTEDSVETLLQEFVDDVDAAREVFCMWPVRIEAKERWQVIDEESWSARATASGRPDDRVSCAVASSWPDADWTSIAVAGRLGGQLVVQVVEHREGTSWVRPRLRELREKYRAPTIIDKGGPAGHLIPTLVKPEDGGRKVPVVSPSQQELGHAAQDFLTEVTSPDGAVVHFDQPELNDAARDAGRRNLGELWTWLRRDTDISTLEAVTLACHGSKHHARRPPRIY